MSEPKEIPLAMLDAATAAITKIRHDRGIGFLSSSEIAALVLRAAGVPALIAELEATVETLSAEAKEALDKLGY